jgi:hypothetical protein
MKLRDLKRRNRRRFSMHVALRWEHQGQTHVERLRLTYRGAGLPHVGKANIGRGINLCFRHPVPAGATVWVTYSPTRHRLGTPHEFAPR